MRSEEYERRRQAIQAQLQADLDLIRAGYEAKLQALETLWLSSPVGAPAAAPRSETGPNETAPNETPLSETLPSETPAGTPARVSQRGGVLREVRAVLPRLPEIFERKDVIQAIGYKPSRATLYRVLATLQEEQEITIARAGDERIQTQYRRQS